MTENHKKMVCVSPQKPLVRVKKSPLIPHFWGVEWGKIGVRSPFRVKKYAERPPKKGVTNPKNGVTNPKNGVAKPKNGVAKRKKARAKG